jgi:transposase
LRASHRQPRQEQPVKPEYLERENERLNRENERLRQELIERDKKIAELERKLALRLQNSTTSSKPPSSDGLAGEQRPRGSRRKKARRKPGGQPGHRGHWRGLAPLSRVDQVIEVLPPKCRYCDSRFSRSMPTQGDARRHQVTELPLIEAHITEYQCQCVACPECGKATQAELPAEAQGQFGPQLTALIAYLTVVCRMPRRMVQELLEQVLAIPLSLGSILNSWEEASEALAEPCAELERQLPHEPVSTAMRQDTGRAEKNAGSGLWWRRTSSSIRQPSRAAPKCWSSCWVRYSPESFAATGCASYLKYHKGEGQFCWAHFKRNILGIQEIGKTTDAERFCRDALALHARLFRLWHRFRDGPGARYGSITREQLIAKSIPLEKKFFALADRYLDSRDKDVANLALALLQHFERFFAFLRHDGVEPTNNVAERALRCAVQWRKISFGSRSAQGEVAVARLLTVTRTCRMQHRAPLVYLVTAIRSHRNALPMLSLLKTASTT